MANGVDDLTDERLLIALRRPRNPSDKQEKLLEQQGELWSQRIDQWKGRAARVLSSGDY